MPRFRIKGPNGESFVVNAPDGATKEQVYAFARQHIASRKPKAATGSSAGAGFMHSGTVGFLDELGAVADTLGIGGSGEERPNIWKGDSFRDAFSANQKRNEQIIDEKRAADPTGFMAGEIAGAVALPTSKLSAVRGLKGAAAAVAESAALGAAYEAGTASGGVRERLQAVPRGLATGAAGGAAGRAVGSAIARGLRGRQVDPAVRKLADEGVVMTPGRRGGAIARTYEEGVLGSIPFVKSIPQAANRRSIEQLNVAAYNRALKPLGQSLPRSTQPGREAVAALGDTVFTAYDDAASRLALGMDKGIETAAKKIGGRAKASAGPNAGQLQAIVDQTLEPLRAGPMSGARVRDTLQDLRGVASGFSRSTSASERNVGDELWRLHDELEAALVRQNKGDVLTPFRKARESVNLFKRVEAAAAKSKDGVFSPQQFRTAVTKRGYGTTVGNVARGQAPMQDLSDAASQVLPGQMPNSGSPERLTALGLGLGGPPALGMVDPVMGSVAGLGTAAYMPGVDRLLQNLALNRPAPLVTAGDVLYQGLPYFGPAGAMAALQQGQ